MRSKNFETQEVRQISRKEAGESRGFPILWMVIIKDVFQMEEKECKDQERLKMLAENPCQSEEGALHWDRQLCLGQWQWTKSGLWLSQEIQREERRSKRTSETPQGTWLGGARTATAEFGKVASASATQGLWLGNIKVGTQVIGEDPRRLPGEEQLRKLGEEEEELATEQRREYADLGFNLGEREEQLPAMPQPWFWQSQTKLVGKRRCKPDDLHYFCEQHLSLTTSSTSADNQVLEWRLMRPKGMEDLAAFSVRELKRAAAEERESDEYSSAKGQ